MVTVLSSVIQMGTNMDPRCGGNALWVMNGEPIATIHSSNALKLAYRRTQAMPKSSLRLHGLRLRTTTAGAESSSVPLALKLAGSLLPDAVRGPALRLTGGELEARRADRSVGAASTDSRSRSFELL